MKPFALVTLALALALLGAGCAASRAQRQDAQDAKERACFPWQQWAVHMAKARDDKVTLVDMHQRLDALSDVDEATKRQLHDLSREIYSPSVSHMTPTQVQQRIALRCLHHNMPTDANFDQPDYARSAANPPDHGPVGSGPLGFSPADRATVHTRCFFGRYYSSCTSNIR